MDNKQKPQNEIKIELTPEVAHGHYSNLAMIAHSPNEFVMDFINMIPNPPQARVQSRIIMTPENARIFSLPFATISSASRIHLVLSSSVVP